MEDTSLNATEAHQDCRGDDQMRILMDSCCLDKNSKEGRFFVLGYELGHSRGMADGIRECLNIVRESGK